MTEWKTYKYTEIADLIGGGTPKTSEPLYWDGDIPWLSVKDFVGDSKYVFSTEKHITKLGLENSSTKLLQKDDIIISARGTVGEMAMIPFPMSFNQSCFGIRANGDFADPHFLYYYTKTKVNELKGNSHGSVFDTITRATFDNIICSLPPLPEQRRIAGILGAIDDKIENNRRINTNLELQAQALFDEWFITNTFRLGVFSKAYLTDIANYLNGLAMQRFRPLEGEIGIPVLKIKELGQGQYDSSSDLCSPSIEEKYIVRDGDIIFSWSGTLLVDIWCGGVCGLNQHLFKVTSDKHPQWFIYYWTKHHLAKFIRIAKDKAVTMGHIKRGDLEVSEVLIPDEKSFAEIDKMMSPIFKAIIANRIANRHLATLRDTLLPKLMNGEIKL